MVWRNEYDWSSFSGWFTGNQKAFVHNRISKRIRAFHMGGSWLKVKLDLGSNRPNSTTRVMKRF